ncbi:hypothetical protein DRN97_07750 [Methanosarcinales archaeon]|nr:MAG: hypothetical protein DRN97_07750 [Methanosarcinales archaeon]
MGGEEMIEVRKDGERIKISFPYNPDYITKIKILKGYRWHPEKKYWSIPSSELEILISVFKNNLKKCRICGFQEKWKRYKWNKMCK